MGKINVSFMMTKWIYCFFYLLAPLILSAQAKGAKSNCNSVKNGRFYFNPANSKKSFTVIRKGGMQAEIDLQTHDTSFWRVNWLEDCRFTAKFIRKSLPMQEKERMFYSSHIVVFKISAVTDDYYLFRAGIDSIENVNSLSDTMWVKPK